MTCILCGSFRVFRLGYDTFWCNTCKRRFPGFPAEDDETTRPCGCSRDPTVFGHLHVMAV